MKGLDTLTRTTNILRVDIQVGDIVSTIETDVMFSYLEKFLIS